MHQSRRGWCGESEQVLDKRSPRVMAYIAGILVENVVVVCGSAVNLMSAELFDRLGFELKKEDSPTVLRLADDSYIKPEGVVRDVPTTVAGKQTLLDFTIVRLPGKGSYCLLMGRPWLRKAECLIDIPSSYLILGRGSKRVLVDAYPGIPGDERAPIPTSKWEGEIITAESTSTSSAGSGEESNTDEVFCITLNEPEEKNPRF